MEKEPSANFCDVWITLHEVMKLPRFEFDVTDVIHANAQNISI